MTEIKGSGFDAYEFLWDEDVEREVSEAVTDVENTLATRAEAYAKSIAHVWSGEMERMAYARIEEIDGEPALVIGSDSDHTIYEVMRGGSHDFITRTLDAIAPLFLPMLEAEMAADVRGVK